MNGQSPIVSEAGRTLIIGSTGYIGRFVTEASLESGGGTYVLVRSRLLSPSKASIIKAFQEKGCHIIYGSINDQSLMEKVIRENHLEVVISAVAGYAILDQIPLIKAIKAAGTVKRFLPSEFGHDIDRAEPVEPGLTMYKEKRKIRRLIEEAGIPHTYICCNSIAAWPYPDNTHPGEVLPPMDCFQIYGDGSVKAYFVDGKDIGNLTIRAVKDDRTINKTVHFRPPKNLLNMNDLSSLWEAKIRRKLPRVTVSEDVLLNAAKEMRIPQSIVAAITHDIFIKGCQVNYNLDKESDVDVCSLYPDATFRIMDDCFDDFLAMLVDNAKTVQKAAGKDNGIIMPDAKREPLPITA
ncbi:hypothetical protein K2173_004078 [Erythroxylum novogranatense]|uniref:NmrA-like domain-containing protein n=1 Tax=Erythroxylum novogranatense TaxID=1862640 RepID=A0AAV8SJQ3_9ROSI|nr:hypothetical protein K2173_004078 [Erythroxylum novogranatense]